MEVVEPKYTNRDFDEGARATLDLMEAKIPNIYQGVLKSGDLLGIPDLLHYDPAGDYYTIGDVKASAEAKVEHAMQVAFYTDILGTLQKRRAPSAFLILADGSRSEIALSDVELLYREAVDDVRAMRGGRDEPRPIYTNYCGGCPWREVCVPEMLQKENLSLVFGVTRARREGLEAAGIINITDLAAIDPSDVAERTELPRETLRRLKLQAMSILQQKPIRLGPFPYKRARTAVAAAVARDPRGTHFAEFLAYRTCKVNDRLEEHWYHFEAAEAAGEEVAYRKFLRALADDFDAPIYHFGDAFPDALASLDARYGKLNDPLDRIFARLCDVQSAVRTALVLPTHHYDLTNMARALGVVLPEPPSPNEDDPQEELILTIRRRTAEEVKAIRNIRVAAHRVWSAFDDGAAADNVKNYNSVA